MCANARGFRHFLVGVPRCGENVILPCFYLTSMNEQSEHLGCSKSGRTLETLWALRLWLLDPFTGSMGLAAPEKRPLGPLPDISLVRVPDLAFFNNSDTPFTSGKRCLLLPGHFCSILLRQARSSLIKIWPVWQRKLREWIMERSRKLNECFRFF